MKTKQVTINAQIKHCERGYYWRLMAIFEGIDRMITIDSSTNETFFSTTQEAFEAVNIAGKDLAEQLAEIFNKILPEAEAYVHDPNTYH